MKKIIIPLLIILLGLAAYFWLSRDKYFKETTNEVQIEQSKTDSLTSNLTLDTDTSTEKTETQIETTEPHKEEYKSVKFTAYGFSSEGLRMKLNNTTAPTDRARNCALIRSTFNIAEDLIASAGPRTVYLQIINPEGNILKDKSSNTVTDATGHEFVYSDKKSIQYDNKITEVTIYYNCINDALLKGEYTINILCDGYVIGSDKIVLK